MASEYLKWKYRDVKPEKPRVLTPAEKWKNWWFYHKWHLVIGVVLMAILGDILWYSLGIGQVKPDYTVAYVGTTALPETAVSDLEAGFAALSQDLNGDGCVSVRVVQYVSFDTGGSDTLYYAQAATAKMIADVTDCESYFFLLEDPDEFQKKTGALCFLDGRVPADDDTSAEGKYLNWGRCPVLAGMDLGENRAQIEKLAFARRGFRTEKRTENFEGCAELWERFTKGAAQ